MASARDSLWLQRAVHNNFDWYAAQCEAHGIAYARGAQSWYTTSPMPPLHSGLCFAATSVPARLIERLQRDAPPEWGVKDALALHDLSPFGLVKLFDAHWFARPPQALDPIPSDARLTVRAVTRLDDYIAWIDAWGETPAGTTVFQPAMLGNSHVRFYTALNVHGEIQGGLATNLSDGCVGVSNFHGDQAAVQACLSRVATDYPELGIVGYDRLDELRWLRPLGFNILGPLTVWVTDHHAAHP